MDGVDGMTGDFMMRTARYATNRKYPYLAEAVMRLTLIESPDVPTIGVDANWHCYYNPVWILQQNPDFLTSVVQHEVGHLLRFHAERAINLGADQQLWNIAADCEINDHIQDLQIKPYCFPDGFNLPNNLLAEEYYDLLKENPPQGEDNSGDGNGSEACDHQHGSAIDGIRRPWETVYDDTNVSEIERQKIRESVAEAIGRGDVPGNWKRFAENALNVKIPWDKWLGARLRKSTATTAGKVDYTWRRPNRRQSTEFIMPSMERPVPRVVVVADTSGSMSTTHDLGRVMSTIKDLIKALGYATKITVLSTDASVHTAKAVFSEKDVELMGGGGTDMRVGIETAERYHPTTIIVVTDGDTPWPARVTTPTFVVLTRPNTVPPHLPSCCIA